MSRPRRATVDLLVVLAAVFGLQQVAGAVGFGIEWFALATPVRRPWTLVTTVYAHASLGHLLANAVGLLVVGLVLERSTTRVRFHAFVLAAGMVSAGVEFLVGAALGTPVAVLGTSGAVLAGVGYLLAGNRLAEGVLARIEIGRRGSAALLLGVAAAVTLLTAGPGVAVVAHFTGFAAGAVAGRVGVLRDGSRTGTVDGVPRQ
jgi:membrane associated rhomboid family serine protease